MQSCNFTCPAWRGKVTSWTFRSLFSYQIECAAGYSSWPHIWMLSCKLNTFYACSIASFIVIIWAIQRRVTWIWIGIWSQLASRNSQSESSLLINQTLVIFGDWNVHYPVFGTYRLGRSPVSRDTIITWPGNAILAPLTRLELAAGLYWWFPYLYPQDHKQNPSV